MKIFGYELNRVKNQIITPMIEKSGSFTLQLSSNSRPSRDVGDLTAAIKQAESTTRPLRYNLYNIYRENRDIVTHLESLINVRHSVLQQRNLQYLKRNGKVDEEMTVWLQSPRFKKLIYEIEETHFWGITLIDFVAYAGSKWFGFDMVNRKHVDPINKVVYKYETGSGPEPYNTKEREKYIIAIGEDRDLGLLKQASYIAIHIRNLMSDMMNYVELAGNNFTVIKTKNNDPRLNSQVMDAMKHLGSSGTLQLPDGVTDVNMESMSSSQQNQLFTSIHDLLNKELSKLFLGSTMVTDDGSSRSQSEVHERTTANIFEMDATYVLDVLNYQFADKLPLFGKNPTGKFAFEENHSQQELTELDKDIKLKSLGLTLSPEYLAEKYGYPPEAISTTMPEPKPTPEPDDDDTPED
jgi:hypothetical protein